MSVHKKTSRIRRGLRVRSQLRERDRHRLTVHRTPRHIYAQIISADGSQTLASASTLEKAIAADLKATGNVSAASAVGRVIAERCLAAGITDVAFDRAGFKYHGRVKALADAAREGGLAF